MVLEGVADKHENGFPEDKEKSAKVDNHQLEEGQDVYLDEKIKQRRVLNWKSKSSEIVIMFIWRF